MRFKSKRRSRSYSLGIGPKGRPSSPLSASASSSIFPIFSELSSNASTSSLGLVYTPDAVTLQLTFLPMEIILCIISQLSVVGIIHLSKTNRFFHEICTQVLQSGSWNNIGNIADFQTKYVVLKKSLNMHLIKNFDHHTLTYTYSASFTNRDWSCLSKYVRLSESFLLEHREKLDWVLISRYQKLTIPFIRKNKALLDRVQVSAHQNLDEEFIEDELDWIDWSMIQRKQKLSEAFIRRHVDQLNWRLVCKYQTLSEDFMREFVRIVNWRQVSKTQKLSENFIREFEDRLSWRHLVLNQKLSSRFLLEYQERVWQYLNVKQKIGLVSSNLAHRYILRTRAGTT